MRTVDGAGRRDKGIPPEELRRRRRALGLTQAALAAELGVAANSVARWERGARAMGSPALVRRALERLEGLDGLERLEVPVSAPVEPSGRLGLPVPLTSFVGRERELAAVRERLRDPGTRLLTLTGPGGVGKTRLALRAAGEATERFPDGACFVALSPLAGPALVLPTVAHALGVRETGRRPLAAAVGEHLRERRLLLVLDNFDHVLEAAPVVTELLAAAPGAGVLVTSRAALRLAGEQVFPVPPLRLPPSRWWPGRPPPGHEALLEYEAVDLFVQRARASKPDFRLTQDNAGAIAAICVRLDGLPLALELAAARVRLLPPQILLARLGRALVLLTDGPRDAPARQQTLRHTIEWSHNLLRPAEQTLLGRLGVFVGGWTLEAAEAVAAGSGPGLVGPRPARPEGEPGTGSGDLPVLEGLAGLVDMSLVRQVEVPSSDGGPEARFEMLETVREFALERLEAGGEGEAVRGRHAAYYLRLAREAEGELRGPRQAWWLDRLEREHENLRQALGQGIVLGRAGDPQGAALALALAGILWRFWWVRGYQSEGRARLAEALALPPPPPLPAWEADPVAAAARAEVAFGAGVLALVAGDWPATRRLTEESLTLWRAAGDEAGVAYCVENLGEVEYVLGDLDAACARLEESVGRFRALDDRQGLAWPLASLGLILHERGDPASRERIEESVALFRASGEHLGLSQALTFLGTVLDDQGDRAGARACFAEALALQRDLGDRSITASTLEGLAALGAGAGGGREEAAQAARLAGLAGAVREAVGNRLWFASPERLTRRLEAVRRTLGEEAFARCFAEGRAQPLEEAIAAVVASEGPLAPAATGPTAAVAGKRPRPQRGPDAGPLSPREREVAALIAQGLSNRQIAERLVITPATAGVHVVHILDKLGMRSRAQVAAWAAERGLLSAPADA
jgi:non-specific serine/threonine protein kinase